MASEGWLSWYGSGWTVLYMAGADGADLAEHGKPASTSGFQVRCPHVVICKPPNSTKRHLPDVIHRALPPH